jgi:TNF receptor-associated factor 4
LQPVECEYKWAGCHHTPLRKDVSLHNTKAQSTHMSLLTQVVDELKKENSKLKEESQKMKKETEQSKKESFIDLLAPLIYVISIR